MTLEAYDHADDSRRSYDVCVDALREQIEKFRCERIGPHRLFLGDCREVMPLVGKVHAVVTDPPYHLTELPHVGKNGFNGNRPDDRKSARRGFMGQTWDGGDIAFRPETWELALNALRPGGHLAAFSGSRTYHRMACAIEDAGFEIRDQLMWVTGQGFPKSRDISKDLDRMAGAEREVVGESPYAKCRSGGRENTYKGRTEYRLGSNADITAPATEAAKKWQGFGTALKPSHEPVCLARKPLDGTVAANVLEHGCGALNIDACRVETVEVKSANRVSNGMGYHGANGGNPRHFGSGRSHDLGRWPANLIHDNSIEVIECFAPEDRPAARFFYSPKVSSEEREGSTHPTMKPVDLMAWLIRLVTPPKGIVLDPFMGSGSTGIAAHRQGFRFIGIEQDEGYFNTAVRRLRAAYEKPDLLIERTKPENPVQETLF